VLDAFAPHFRVVLDEARTGPLIPGWLTQRSVRLNDTIRGRRWDTEPEQDLDDLFRRLDVQSTIDQ
jgi:hypothetical protein